MTLKKLKSNSSFQLVENGPVYIKIRGTTCCPGCGGERFRLSENTPVIEYFA